VSESPSHEIMLLLVAIAPRNNIAKLKVVIASEAKQSLSIFTENFCLTLVQFLGTQLCFSV